jgi:hypothetical protein
MEGHRCVSYEVWTSSTYKEVKRSPIKGRGGLKECEMTRILHYLDTRITDSGEVVSLTHWPLSLLHRNIIISVPATHFYYRLSKPHGIVLPKRLGKLITFGYLIQPRNRDLPVGSIVPQSVHFRGSQNTDVVPWNRLTSLTPILLQLPFVILPFFFQSCKISALTKDETIQ